MKTSTEVRLHNRMGTLVAAGVLLVASLLASVALAQSEGVTATLLLYSGREDPRIELGAEEIDQLRAFVSDLADNPEFRGESVNPSILGYSGLIVTNDANVAGLPEYLAAFGADVEVGGAEGRQFLRDENRNIENWMVQRFMARDLVDDQALKLIRSAQ